MENIIEKEPYDTESSELKLIGTWNNGFPVDDPRCAYEVLWQVSDDYYVIFSLCGPMSSDVENTGNNINGKDDAIFPLMGPVSQYEEITRDNRMNFIIITKDSAITWAMNRLSEQEVKENFLDAIK